MPSKSPMSLFEGALKEAIKLFLINPSLLYKMPPTMRRDLATQCRETLTTYFKRMHRERNRKSVFSQERLNSLFNLKEFASIPKRLKHGKIFQHKQTLANLEARELAKFSPFVKT